MLQDIVILGLDKLGAPQRGRGILLFGRSGWRAGNLA